MGSKAAEALQHIKSAEKILKTSLLKWKPDFDSAADEYSQAAQCYRIARQLKDSRECHIKAAEFYQKNRSYFHAGKALENAIIVDKENMPPDEVFSMALDSSSLYQQHGSADSAANVLDKAAKIIEETCPERAYKLYQMASDVSTGEGSSHQGMEYTAKASRLLVRLHMYDEASDSIRREIDLNLEASNYGAVGRLTVCSVLVHLARGDIVAAEKCYREWGGNCEMAEQETLERLLAAYDDEDAEAAARALASPFIRAMDVEYARLAARLDLPAGEPVVSVGVRLNAAAPYIPLKDRVATTTAQVNAAASAVRAAGAAAAAASAPQQPYQFDDMKGSLEEAKPAKEDDEEEGGMC